jgi:hypothetical protein
LHGWSYNLDIICHEKIKENINLLLGHRELVKGANFSSILGVFNPLEHICGQNTLRPHLRGRNSGGINVFVKNHLLGEVFLGVVTLS